MQAIRISRTLDLESQIILETLMDEFADLGLYEKTLDDVSREPVYLLLE